MKFTSIALALLTLSLPVGIHAGNTRSTHKKASEPVVQTKLNYVTITQNFVRYLGIQNPVKIITEDIPENASNHDKCTALGLGHITQDTIYLNTAHLHNRSSAESLFVCAHLAAHYAQHLNHNNLLATHIIGAGTAIGSYLITRQHLSKPLQIIISGILGSITWVTCKHFIAKHQEIDADITAARTLCAHGYAWVVKELLAEWQHELPYHIEHYAQIHQVWLAWEKEHIQEAQQATKHAQENITDDLRVSLSDAQRTKLHTILAAAQQAVVATNVWFDQFFSTKNNESYGTHLNKLQHIVQNIDEHIRKPLQACNGHGALFTTAEEIITMLYEQMYITYITLDKCRGTKNPLRLGTQLRKLDQQVNSRQAQQALDAQLNKLYTILKNKEKKLAEDVQKLHTTIKQNRADRSEKTMVSYASGLAHRIRC